MNWFEGGKQHIREREKVVISDALPLETARPTSRSRLRPLMHHSAKLGNGRASKLRVGYGIKNSREI